MGLIITSTEQTTLKVKGFNGTIDSCYLRLRGFFQQDGRSMEIQCDSYHSKANFTNGESLPIQFQSEGAHQELPVIQCTIAIDEIQGVETCHKYAKQAFEELGYTVTIDL